MRLTSIFLMVFGWQSEGAVWAAPTDAFLSIPARVAQGIYDYRKAATGTKGVASVDGKVRVSVQMAQLEPSSSETDLSKKEGTFAVGGLLTDGGNAGGVVQAFWIPQGTAPLVHLASLAVGPDQFLQQSDMTSASLFSVTHPALTFAEARDATLVLEEVKLTSESIDGITRKEFAINTQKGKKTWEQRKAKLPAQPKPLYCEIVNDKVVDDCK